MPLALSLTGYLVTETSARSRAGSTAGPVVVLTYAHSGFPLLANLLSASSTLTCTSGKGVLTACYAAAETWRRIDGRASGLSALAAKSIRLMASTMVAVSQAASPGSRWCETAATVPRAAWDFARLFPETTFLSLHRDLRGVLGAAITSWRWGLAGSPFWPYTAKHPGDSAAAIAAYWIASTQALLDFEDSHADSCLRLRYEDVAAEPRRVGEMLIYPYLGLDSRDLALLNEVTNHAADGAPGTGTPDAVPVPRLPSGLLAEINGLHGRLGYDPWPEPAEAGTHR